MSLTPVQERLLHDLAERSGQGAPHEREFLLATSFDGTEAIFESGAPGLPEISQADFDELVGQGFIRTRFGSQGSTIGSVTNAGLEYVANMVSKAPGPVLVERAMNLVRGDLPEAYRTAQSLIEEAAKKLYIAKTEHDLSEVGHRCREAMQEFAVVLYDQHVPLTEQDKGLSRAKTAARIKKVLEAWKAGIGDTSYALLEVLLAYWGTVSDLIQKVEHRSEKDGRPLTQDDARRAVLYSYLVMAELAEAEPRK